MVEQRNSPIKEYAELDRLKGTAILLTLFCHMGSFVPPRLERLYPFLGGVDLFFVISGFLITTSLLRDLPEFTTSMTLADRLDCSLEELKSYFLRRGYRLIPIAALALALPFILSVTYNQSSAFPSLKEHATSVAGVLTGFGNYLASAGYPIGRNLIFWSLAVEVHFYVLLPALFLLFPTRSNRLFASLGVVAAVWFVLRPFAQVQSGMSEWHLYSLTHLKMDVPFMGVLLALVLGRRPTTSRRPPHPLTRFVFVPGLLAFTMMLPWFTALRPGPSYYLHHSVAISLALGCAALVQLARLNRGYVLDFPLISPALEWLGRRCYSLYLLHLIVFGVTVESFFRLKKLGGLPSWIFSTPSGWFTQLFTAVTLSVIVADFSYRWLERPFQIKGRKLASPPPPSPCPELPSIPLPRQWV